MEMKEHAQKEVLQIYNQHLEFLQSEVDRLKENYRKLERHHQRHSAVFDRSNVFSECSVLGKKLEVKSDLSTKCSSLETKRLEQLKDLGALEARRKSLSLKVQLFQASGGYLSQQEAVDGGASQESDVTVLQAKLEEALVMVNDYDLKAQRLRVALEETRRRSEEETQRLGLEFELKCMEHQKSAQEVEKLKSVLRTTEDLLQAEQVEKRRLRMEVSTLQEHLLAQQSALRVPVIEATSAHRLNQGGGEKQVGTEMLGLRGAVGRLQQRLLSSDRQGALLREDIKGLQISLETYHSLTTHLRESLDKRTQELKSLEHARFLQDNEIAILKEELRKWPCERVQMDNTTKDSDAQWRIGERAVDSVTPRFALTRPSTSWSQGDQTYYCKPRLCGTAHTKTGDALLQKDNTIKLLQMPACPKSPQSTTSSDQTRDGEDALVAEEPPHCHGNSNSGESPESRTVKIFLREEGYRTKKLEASLKSHIQQLHQDICRTIELRSVNKITVCSFTG